MQLCVVYTWRVVEVEVGWERGWWDRESMRYSPIPSNASRCHVPLFHPETRLSGLSITPKLLSFSVLLLCYGTPPHRTTSYYTPSSSPTTHSFSSTFFFVIFLSFLYHIYSCGNRVLDSCTFYIVSTCAYIWFGWRIFLSGGKCDLRLGEKDFFIWFWILEFSLVLQRKVFGVESYTVILI